MAPSFGAAASPAPRVEVRLGEPLEQVIELEAWLAWGGCDGSSPNAEGHVASFAVEVVDDPAPRARGRPAPPPGTRRNLVQCGRGPALKLRRMPSGRHFLIDVQADVEGVTVRSGWLRARTLPPAKASASPGLYIDLREASRGACLVCPCLAFRSRAKQPALLVGRAGACCRACGCPAAQHRLLDAVALLDGQSSREFVVALPREAQPWDRHELGLYVSSRGLFHPGKMAAKRRPLPARSTGQACRVSVVCPTTESRHEFHEELWSVFNAQLWPEKELIVVETFSQRKSRFFEEKARVDDRIVYVPLRVPSTSEDLSIGLKRNMGTHLSSGALIVNFDDDDLYAPRYIGALVEALQAQEAQAITLGSWFVFEPATGKFGHADPRSGQGRKSPVLADQWLFGYGFSYAFSRELALDIGFPDVDLGEDYEFFRQVRLRHLLESQRAARAADVAAAAAGAEAESQEGAGRDEATDGCGSGEPETEAGAPAGCSWVEEVDAITGASFYRNTLTKEVQWEPPEDFAPRESAAGAGGSLKAPRAPEEEEEDDDDDEEDDEDGSLDREEAALEGLPQLAPLQRCGVALLFDVQGLCLHMLHAGSTSGREAEADPLEQALVSEVTREDAESLEVVQACKAVTRRLDYLQGTKRSSRLIRPVFARFQTIAIHGPSGQEARIKVRTWATTAGDAAEARAAELEEARRQRVQEMASELEALESGLQRRRQLAERRRAEEEAGAAELAAEAAASDAAWRREVDEARQRRLAREREEEVRAKEEERALWEELRAVGGTDESAAAQERVPLPELQRRIQTMHAEHERRVREAQHQAERQRTEEVAERKALLQKQVEDRRRRELARQEAEKSAAWAQAVQATRRRLEDESIEPGTGLDVVAPDVVGGAPAPPPPAIRAPSAPRTGHPGRRVQYVRGPASARCSAKFPQD